MTRSANAAGAATRHSVFATPRQYEMSRGASCHRHPECVRTIQVMQLRTVYHLSSFCNHVLAEPSPILSYKKQWPMHTTGRRAASVYFALSRGVSRPRIAPGAT